MRGIIYKATNTFNGKVYIGQTVAGLPKRRKQHYKDAKNDESNLFHFALYQYPNGFTWDVVDTFEGDRESVIHALNVAEEYHILKYNSTDQRFGYNSTGGGYSSDKFSEHIKKRAQAIGGDAKPVLQYDLSGTFIREFMSLNEVSAFLNRDKVSPKDLITGIHYGFQWRMKKNEYYPKNIGEYKQTDGTRKVTPIIAYDSDGQFFKRFVCAEDAERETGIKKSSILDWSHGKTPDNVVVAERNAKSFYFFRDTEDYPTKIDILVIQKKTAPDSKNQPQKKRISVFSVDGQLIESGEFYYADIEKKYNTTAETVKRDCDSSLPFIISGKCHRMVFFRYADDGATKIQIIKKEKKPQKEPKMEHRIIQYTLDGEFLKVWDNTHQAAESGADTENLIRKCLAGTFKSPKLKYQWAYYTPNYEQNIGKMTPSSYGGKTLRSNSREDDRIEEVDKAGNVVAVYKDTADAAEKSGYSHSYICNVLAGRIHHPKRKFRRAK